ncbi:MAG: ATP-grasp domain-containing protein, partial [Desulfatiglandales bacterium]
MRLQEYEAKEIFRTYGIPIPESRVVRDPEAALRAGLDLGLPVMLKAQVLVGGRGKAGGVVKCETPEEVLTFSEELFRREIKGLVPKELMVEKACEVEKEIYLGVVVDGYEGRPVLIFSKRGGVDVEDVFRRHPEEVIKLSLPIDGGFLPYQARGLSKGLGFSGEGMLSISKVIYLLVKVFYEYEALLAEINPLGISSSGDSICLDAVLEVDNSALKRIRANLPNPATRIENPLERKGREIGVTYVDLDGDIG